VAFPTIPTSAAGRIVSAANTNPAGTHTFPNLNTLTKAAGDLLIAIVIIYDGNSTNAEFSSWGGGFTEFVDQATTATMGIGVAYKWSTGSETGTFTVTSVDASANDSVCILLAIPGAHASTPPEGGTIANGTAAAANIAALNPAGWAAEDTLWIAVCGAGEDSTTGSFTAPSAAPANYGSLFATAVSADVVGGVYGAVAFRQLNAASDDPATFTVDVSNARNSALVLAVRPVPAPVEIDGSLAATATLTATAALDLPASGTLAVTAALTAAAAVDLPAAGNLAATATLTGDATVTAGGNQVDADGALSLTATLTATAALDLPADGTLAVTSALTATATADRPVEGDLAATASSTATATVDHPVDGNLAATATLTATAATAAVATGNLAATATLTGTAEAVPAGKNIDGDLAATATVTGTAAADRPVAATLALTTTLTGDATVARAVDGALPVVATISGDASVTGLGQVDVAGSLAITITLTAAAALPPGDSMALVSATRATRTATRTATPRFTSATIGGRQ
jgi:hypothetical protein